MTRRIVLHLVFAVALLVAGRETADAQTPARQAASDLSRQLMSPFCPGKLLADCTSPNAGELREAIDAFRVFVTDIIAGGPVPDIGAESDRMPAGVEQLDLVDAAFAGDDLLPEFFDLTTQRGDDPQTGNDNPPFHEREPRKQ